MITENHIGMLIEVLEKQPKHFGGKEEIEYPQEMKVIFNDFLIHDLDERQVSFLVKQVNRKAGNEMQEYMGVTYFHCPTRIIGYKDVLNLIAKFGTKKLRQRAQKLLRICRKANYKGNYIVVSFWITPENIESFLLKGEPTWLTAMGQPMWENKIKVS